MDIFVDSLNRRKDRAIAIILGQKERECDNFLPKDVAARFRKIILDQINDFHAFAVDMVSSSHSGMIPNHEYFERLESLMSSLEQEMGNGKISEA